MSLLTRWASLSSGPAPAWLVRPGRWECGSRWSLFQGMYRELTGLELPETMPSRETRRVDGVLIRPGAPPCIIEVDEAQHFNAFRAATIRAYPQDVRLGFDRQLWISRSESKRRLEGGGFAKPRPPLFPGENGRHRQRAFRDALSDILPLEHGFEPTIRIADFEVRDWLTQPDARNRMAELLKPRLTVERYSAPATGSANEYTAIPGAA